MDNEVYSPTKSLGKAFPPAITAVIVECVDAGLQQGGIHIEKAHLYQMGTALCCAYLAFVNWFKNRKKKAGKK